MTIIKKKIIIYNRKMRRSTNIGEKDFLPQKMRNIAIRNMMIVKTKTTISMICGNLKELKITVP